MRFVLFALISILATAALAHEPGHPYVEPPPIYFSPPPNLVNPPRDPAEHLIELEWMSRLADPCRRNCCQPVIPPWRFKEAIYGPLPWR
jgi:hypothetical protein